jgi:hypothetical protein
MLTAPAIHRSQPAARASTTIDRGQDVDEVPSADHRRLATRSRSSRARALRVSGPALPQDQALHKDGRAGRPAAWARRPLGGRHREDRLAQRVGEGSSATRSAATGWFGSGVWWSGDTRQMPCDRHHHGDHRRGSGHLLCRADRYCEMNGAGALAGGTVRERLTALESRQVRATIGAWFARRSIGAFARRSIGAFARRSITTSLARGSWQAVAPAWTRALRHLGQLR